MAGQPVPSPGEAPQSPAPSHDSAFFLESRPLAPGEVFADRYLIHEELGRGGFGVVYRAFDRGPLQRTIALKTIRFAARPNPTESAFARRQFLDEARVAGNLSHANIATIFDVSEHGGTVYMTQELAPGRDLGRLIRAGGPLPLRRTIAIIRQVCEGLAHAHARAIVHRDIKPGNIVVDDQDRVKITDFGIAQPRELETTVSNLAAGTPGYAAPEQLCGERVDPRADVFSVGCVLYELLAGRPAFEGSTVASVIEKTLHSIPPAPSGIREEAPRTLDRVVGRALRKNRAERYDNVGLLAQDLLNYQQFEHLVDQATGAQEISTALQARQCLLFFGLRLPAGGPAESATSDDLIVDALAERSGTPRDGRGLARLSQDIEIERGRTEMLRHLAAAVRSPRLSPREIVRRIAHLPFPVIVTTRYDTFLEEELTRAGRRFRRVGDCRRMPDELSDGEDLVVQLFGTVDDEESVIVTEDDLWGFFERFHLLPDTLKSLLARRVILFAGYDPEDEGFRHLLVEVTRFRAGVREGCYLPVADTSLAALRWSQSKGLRLIDAEPGPFLSLVEQSITERRRQASVEAAAPAARLPGRPYKFLNYFDADDERIFFGRRAEVHKLVSKIHAHPLNVLYAASGCGKTSLIRAGLIPQLRRDGDVPVYVRVYDNPADEIRKAVLEVVQNGAPVPADAPLPQLLSTLGSGSGQRIIVFVDQFEEIFVRHDREARDRFAAAVESAISLGKGHVRFVLSLREDFLPRLSELRGRLPTIFHNEFRLDRLSTDAGRAAIAEPATLFGLEVEPALIDRLLEDLAQDGVDPPQLQIVCDTLYDSLPPGGKRITLESYLALGGTRKVLSDYLGRVLRELPASERDTAREVLKQLVTAEETKSVSRLADLARLAARSEDEVSRVLADLSNRRLVREVPRDDGFWFELSHEYLLQEISQWLSAQEKELKRIRELLEQAVRNRRNLGMLMPPAQVRLVRQREDDLALNKEERQLLRDSQQASRTRLKTVAVAAVAATLVLAAGGVAARYGYLATHRFIESRGTELVDVLRGQKVGRRVEEIRLYTGSPSPSWLDRRLGFPKFFYATDFDLNQIDPARRDPLRAGLLFGGDADLEQEIVAILQPTDRARFLLTTGRTDEAVKLLLTLYQDQSVDKASLERLTVLAGYSAVSDLPLAQAAVRHAFRPAVTTGPTVMGSAAAPAELVRPLLTNIAGGGWRAVVVPYLANPSDRRRAVELVGALGDSSDVAIVRPLLDDREGTEALGREVRSVALRALDNVGDCTALEAINRLIVDRDVDINTKLAAFTYISRCGTTLDMKTLEASMNAPAGGMPLEMQVMTIGRTLYQAFGAAAVPIIRRSLGTGPLTTYKLSTLSVVMEPEILPDLRAALGGPLVSAKGQVAAILASRGDTAGLPEAARIAKDRGQTSETRAAALRAFLYVKGPAVRTLATEIATSATEPEVRAIAVRALRWYDDDETLTTLFGALKDNDRAVREAALESFTFAPSTRAADWVAQRARDVAIGHRIYATRVLQQARQGNYAGTYRSLLAEAAASADYPAVTQAIIGLRDAYLDDPLTSVIEGLSDPLRGVRLAATLAIVEHPERARIGDLLKATESRGEMRAAIARAAWVAGVAARADAWVEQAQSALNAGDIPRAAQRLTLLTSPRSGYLAALRYGLSTSVSIPARTPLDPTDSYLFEEAFPPRSSKLRLLQSEVTLRRTGVSAAASAINSYLTQNPAMRTALRDRPQFSGLRTLYEFRLLTGLQQPITVGENFLASASPAPQP